MWSGDIKVGPAANVEPLNSSSEPRYWGAACFMLHTIITAIIHRPVTEYLRPPTTFLLCSRQAAHRHHDPAHVTLPGQHLLDTALPLCFTHHPSHMSNLDYQKLNHGRDLNTVKRLMRSSSFKDCR